MKGQRLHTIKIKWSYPKPWNDYMNIPCIDYPMGGLYYITSKIFHRNGSVSEKPIYVGETKRPFYKRFKEHEKKGSPWLMKNGEFYVRIGIIDSPKLLPPIWCDNYKHLLRCLESGTISQLLRLNPNLRRLSNVSQTQKYSGWYDLRIFNEGYHHILQQKFNNRDDEQNEI